MDCTILCPLAFEAAIVRRVLGMPVRTTGIGPRAADAVTDIPAGHTVAVIGTAGAIDTSLRAGGAHLVTSVQYHDDRFECTYDAPPCASITVDAAVLTPPEKERLRAASGAQLVDLETGPIIRAATERNLDWIVVRAVSDDATTRLPASVARIIDKRGRTHPIRAATFGIRHPRLAVRLRRHAHIGLTAAARLVAERCA